jgi:hypothetical protein
VSISLLASGQRTEQFAAEAWVASVSLDILTKTAFSEDIDLAKPQVRHVERARQANIVRDTAERAVPRASTRQRRWSRPLTVLSTNLLISGEGVGSATGSKRLVNAIDAEAKRGSVSSLRAMRPMRCADLRRSLAAIKRVRVGAATSCQLEFARAAPGRS